MCKQQDLAPVSPHKIGLNKYFVLILSVTLLFEYTVINNKLICIEQCLYYLFFILSIYYLYCEGVLLDLLPVLVFAFSLF